MRRQHPKAPEDEFQVVPFRARGLGASGETRHRPQPPASPIESLAKYEGGEEQEDTYRHRMMVNLAALAVTVVLALAGVWLAMQIAELRKNEDCVLIGRRNCNPIDVNTLKR